MQELTTYFDDTRYENLTSLKSDEKVGQDKLSAKLAKLSALDNVRKKTNKIKEDLQNSTTVELEQTETPQEVKSIEQQPVENNPTTEPVQPTLEETSTNFPSNDVIEAKVAEKGVTVYNGIEKGSNDAEVACRKLRVAPQVTQNIKYIMNVVGVEFEYQPSKVDTNDDTPTVEPEVNNEENVAYDFGALPGVGLDNTTEQPVYEENIHREQDDRLNDYLNRENYNDNDVNYSDNFDELEEIRRLKREIEEAREALNQVQQNIGDLQQTDNAYSEQLAAYKRSLIEEKDALNAELVDQTREWDGLTQLVRQKKELIDEQEESIGMSK